MVIKEKKDERILVLGENKFELVDFRLNEEDENGVKKEHIYGLNISKVKEIIKMQNITRIPSAPEHVIGILHLRDNAIPIINLCSYLNFNNTTVSKNDKIIIMSFMDYIVGFTVHTAKRIRRISWDKIIPPKATLNSNATSCVTGMTKLEEEDDLLFILDFEKITNEINTGDTDYNVVLETPPDKKDAVDQIVVYADDSALARMQIKKTLDQAGYKSLGANNGFEALKAIEDLSIQLQEKGQDINDHVAIIITDIEMPQMDGYTLTQMLRKNPKFNKLPIIMHSTLSGKENLSKGKSVGVDDYIVKFNPDDLLRKINQYKTIGRHG